MLASARVIDRAGMDTIWLAEAYPWWRKHQMEARSSTVVSALIARETEQLTVGWGIISPVHAPPGAGGDGRAGRPGGGRAGPLPPRLRDVEDLSEQRALQTKKTLGPMRDAVDDRARRPLRRRVRLRGRDVERVRPRAQDEARHAARGAARLRRRDRAEDAGARRRDRRRLPDAVDHDAGVRPLHARERRAPTSTSAAPSSPRSTTTDRDEGRDGAREIAGMYLANKVQNIRGAADTLLELAGLEQEEIRPVAEAMEQGGRLAAKERGDRRDARPAASRSRARPPTASRRSRSTATRAARTSCSSSGATSGTSRSSSSASEVLPHFR